MTELETKYSGELQRSSQSCDDSNLKLCRPLSKEISTMNVGRKKPIMPSPRCMDKLRNDLKEHQVDPKLAQKMEELKKQS